MLGFRHLQRLAVSLRHWLVEVEEVDESNAILTCNGKSITREEFSELLHIYFVGCQMAEHAHAHAIRCRVILGVEHEHDAISDYADEVVLMHAHPSDAIRRINKAVGEVSQ